MKGPEDAGWKILAERRASDHHNQRASQKYHLTCPYPREQDSSLTFVLPDLREWLPRPAANDQTDRGGVCIWINMYILQ